MAFTPLGMYTWWAGSSGPALALSGLCTFDLLRDERLQGLVCCVHVFGEVLQLGQ